MWYVVEVLLSYVTGLLLSICRGRGELRMKRVIVVKGETCRIERENYRE